MSTSPAENINPVFKSQSIKQEEQKTSDKFDASTVTPPAASVAADYDASNTERPLLQKQRYRSHKCKAFCQSGGGGGIHLHCQLNLKSSFSLPPPLFSYICLSLVWLCLFQDSKNLFRHSDAQADRSSGEGISAHRLLLYAVRYYAAYNILDAEIMTLSARRRHRDLFLIFLVLNVLFYIFIFPPFVLPFFFTECATFRMTVLASREHTCIHPVVSRSSNKNEGCRELNDKMKARREVRYLSYVLCKVQLHKRFEFRVLQISPLETEGLVTLGHKPRKNYSCVFSCERNEVKSTWSFYVHVSIWGRGGRSVFTKTDQMVDAQGKVIAGFMF